MGSFLIKNSFSDFDEFSHAVQDWDLDFLQLDRGSFQTDILQLGTGRIIFGHAQFNRSFDQRGSAPLETWTFAIFSQKSTPLVWHEQEIFNNSIVVYKPGSEIDCVSRPGFEVFTLSYPEEYLNGIASNLGLPEIKKLVNSSDNFECSLSELFKIRSPMHQIIDTFKHSSSVIEDISFRHTLDVELTEQILLTLARSIPAKNSSLRVRNLAIKRIKEYLTEFPDEPLTVNRLCNIAKVSIRTLQYVFKEHYGVSPNAYLKSYRLNAVHSVLWESDPASTKVNDVANSWGFWHMGQFAADYRKLFGELPSDTLRNVNL